MMHYEVYSSRRTIPLAEFDAPSDKVAEKTLIDNHEDPKKNPAQEFENLCLVRLNNNGQVVLVRFRWAHPMEGK